MGGGHRDGQQGVRAQFAFVLGAIQLDHRGVESPGGLRRLGDGVAAARLGLGPAEAAAHQDHQGRSRGQETATDDDYEHIEGVIGHEYFHNWTGNRVTCRDWFQLSLKEGLTVFRDQCFSADHGSPEVVRIEQVRMLRTLQFPEDAGPTSHPVRPDAYSEVNNLYTATVYEKGAEILRMLCGLLGADTFVAGVREYLRRHDGTAATVEDLLDALHAVGGRRLDGFARWYAQSGTPRVEIQDEYDPATQRYRLRPQQSTPPTADQAHRQVLPIPVRIGLRDAQGRPLPVNSDSPLLARPDLILLETEHAEIEFTGLEQAPIPSFLHGFSAPVHLAFAHPPEALAVLAVTVASVRSATDASSIKSPPPKSALFSSSVVPLMVTSQPA